MGENSGKPKNREAVIASLNMAICAVEAAQKTPSLTMVALASLSALLRALRDTLEGQGHVDLGSLPIEIFKAFREGVPGGMNPLEISQFVRDTAARLKAIGVEVQSKQDKWNAVSQLFYAKDGKGNIKAKL